MTTYYEVSTPTLGDLRAATHHLPDSTKLVQINPVNKEETVTLYVEKTYDEIRVVIYEG